MGDARYTEQVTALVDPTMKAQIRRITDGLKGQGHQVSQGDVIRNALRHGLPMTEREAQRGRLRGE